MTAAGISKVAVGSIAVLGSYPQYIAKAIEIGASFFQIPMDAWDNMTEAQRWAANTAFLDQAIANGATFLVESAKAIRDSSFLYREIQYLLDHGYKWLEDLSGLAPLN